MKIISWQYLLTDHQVFTWLELQNRGHMVHFVLGRAQDEKRTKQGWNTSTIESLTTQPLPNKDWWKIGREIILNNKDAIHIFSGFWADKRFFALILFALHKGVKTMVMNESYAEVQAGYLQEENGIKSNIKVHLRPMLYKSAILLCRLASKINPIKVLAISQLAEKQFLKAGVDSMNIFPWGYFVPKKVVTKKKQVEEKPTRLVFIGNLLLTKGLDIAVEAIEEINRKQSLSVIHMDVYGPGDPNQWIHAETFGTTYKGAIPFGHSQEILVEYDYLILPSRHDGWGVVVNEALLQGVPVILSDSVGAKTLLDRNDAGIVFKSENIEDLFYRLNEIIQEPDKHKEYAKQAALIAPKLLPSEAAIYMEEILEYTFQGSGPRPIPNWER